MKKRLSFFSILFFGNIVLAGIIILISGFFAWHHLNAKYQEASKIEQDRISAVIRSFFEHTWPEHGPKTKEINQICSRIISDPDIRITVIYKDGLVLGDNRADPTSMENHKTGDRPEVIKALNTGKPEWDTRTSETLNIDFRYLAQPIVVGDEIQGVVRIAMPVRAIAEGRSLIKSSLIGSALLAIISAIILALILSWIWYSPLKQITQAAGEIASGKLDSRVSISGSSELARLSVALNEMRSSLARQFKTIASQRTNLSTVITTLQEGVVAIDNRFRVVLLNSSAKVLLEIDQSDTENANLQTLVRIPDAIDMVNRTLETNEVVYRQVQTKIKNIPTTLELTSVPVATQGTDTIKTILVIRDITDQSLMAKIKSEFVANASHELRTPLATMRAAVDALRSTDPDDREAIRKFVDILDCHTNRLEAMTGDLLDLHMVERASGKLHVTEIEVNRLAAWTRDQYSQNASNKNIDLSIVAEGETGTFRSDEKLLQLIIRNLVHNAIKFTNPGGTVECSFILAGKTLTLRVRDTGSGIPVEYRDRIFERFFQVEPSRTGDSTIRGTGLGLAIVKHASERLNATIELTSETGEGTTVEILIPESVTT